MLLLAGLVLIITSAFGSELCKEKHWFNDMTGNCQPCTVCVGKSWEMAPCLDFSDTVCVNLIEIGRSLQKRIEIDRKSGQGSNDLAHPHKWHEMEGNDPDLAGVFSEKKVSKSDITEIDNMWSQVILVAMSVGFLFIVIAIIFMMMRYCAKVGNRNGKLL
ncbi:TNFR-Cys domain-containing protein [Trichonephila clavipes]|nr:TNFR-Cys domain-containing protein [Trichonephila clavipes]